MKAVGNDRTGQERLVNQLISVVPEFSPVLRDWPQQGPVGIHGTDDPSAIGRAVSHGCIRVPNPAMLRLFAETPAGTPILIRA